MQTPIGTSLHLLFLVSDAFAEVGSNAVTAAWQRWIGPGRFARKLEQFAQAGWVERGPASASTERIIRMTSAGRLAAIGGRDPEVCWRRRWDGRWRIVLFDVPEAQSALRKELRRKLRSWGFGYLQHSAWVTPDSVDSLRSIAGDAATDVETFSFFEARPCAGETDLQLVLGAWDFARINRGYEICCEILDSAPGRLAAADTRRAWFEAEWRAWNQAVRADPLLPEGLLPHTYRGCKAWQRRKAVLQRLVTGR